MTSREDHKAVQLKTLSLALQVLECFDVQRPERGVTDLANALGVSKATVFRVLSTLESYDYIQQNPSTGRYGLGRRLKEISALAETRWSLTHEVQPYMEELSELTGDAIHLVVFDGGEVVNIATADGQAKAMVNLRNGSRLPAHAVAVGKVLLAYTAPERVYDLLGDDPVRFTRRTLAGAALDRALAQIRYDGYAVNWGELHPDSRGMAVPIIDASGAACAALGICGPMERLTEAYIQARIPHMVGVANRLSADLAAPPRDLPDPHRAALRRRRAGQVAASLA